MRKLLLTGLLAAALPSSAVAMMQDTDGDAGFIDDLTCYFLLQGMEEDNGGAVALMRHYFTGKLAAQDIPDGWEDRPLTEPLRSNDIGNALQSCVDDFNEGKRRVDATLMGDE